MLNKRKKFKSSIKHIIAKYLARGDLKIQREYFLTKCFKGRSQTVKDIDLHIRTICRYCDRFPGSKKDKFDDEDIKHFIYQAMPPGLKLAFDRAGKTWFDEDLSRADMVNFLHTVQQSYQQQQQQEQNRKRQQQNQGQGQRPQKRHQNVVREYNEFLNWQRHRNNTYQNQGYYPSQVLSPSPSPQRTPTPRFQQTPQMPSARMPPPTTPYRASRPNQRGPSTSRPSNNNINNNNNRYFTRSTRPLNRRLFNTNTNDNFYSGEQYENNDETQDYDHTNDYTNTYDDQYFNDLPTEEVTGECQDPDEYIQDDSFQHMQGNNDNDMFFSDFFRKC